MKKIWDWLVTSSADPSKLALTVKGFLGMAATFLVFVSPILHLHLGDEQVTAVSDLVVQIVVVLAGIVSAIATLLGLARKIYLTWQDRNS